METLQNLFVEIFFLRLLWVFFEFFISLGLNVNYIPFAVLLLCLFFNGKVFILELMILEECLIVGTFSSLFLSLFYDQPVIGNGIHCSVNKFFMQGTLHLASVEVCFHFLR